MAQPWDNTGKRLIKESIQDFLDWLLPGAQATGRRSHEFESRRLDADSFYEATLNDELILVNIELQSSADADMEIRLLEYNILAYRDYKCPVYSLVIYLKDAGKLPTPPFVISLSNGQEIVRFHYKAIDIGGMALEELLSIGRTGLLPFAPLTRDGNQREVVETILTKLESVEQQKQENLISLTFAFASLAFKTEEDQTWLIRRLAMQQDILRDTPVYQYILKEGRQEGLQEGRQEGLQEGRQEGRQEGLQEGLEKGLQKGRLETARELLLNFVDTRFPILSKLAKREAKKIQNYKILEDLILKVGLAENMEEAQDYLLEWDETYKDLLQ